MADEPKLSLPEQAARDVLRKLEFEVVSVPRSSEKTPDFLVDGDEPGYVVEVASRFLDERAYRDLLDLDQSWDSKVQDWLSQARQQCRTVDPNHERLWIVWGSAEAPGIAVAQIERIAHSLYGVRNAIEIEPPHRELTVLYAVPPLFERFPEIDLVVLFLPGSRCAVSVCLNECSPRLDLARRSKLVSRLSAAGARVVEPARLDHPKVCVVPSTVDRTSLGATLKYVQGILGTPYVTYTTERQAIGILRVPRSHFE